MQTPGPEQFPWPEQLFTFTQETEINATSLAKNIHLIQNNCKYKFKFFIKACHLLSLILVQSCASNIEDNFWTANIRWRIVECALS